MSGPPSKFLDLPECTFTLTNPRLDGPYAYQVPAAQILAKINHATRLIRTNDRYPATAAVFVRSHLAPALQELADWMIHQAILLQRDLESFTAQGPDADDRRTLRRRRIEGTLATASVMERTRLECLDAAAAFPDGALPPVRALAAAPAIEGSD